MNIAHKKMLTENDQEIRRQIYFSSDIKVCLQELSKRKNDIKLEQTVLDYLSSIGLPFKSFSPSRPYAVLSRSVSSSNFEQLLFLEIAKKYDLIPIILEYSGKFVTLNQEKMYSARMCFFDQEKVRKVSSIDIIDINYWQGKKMSEITTKNGKNFRDFHHEIFLQYTGFKDENIIDFTDWFNIARKSNDYYYFLFLSLFLKNSLLFDNYILSDLSEREFVVEKIVPSIWEIEKQFGVKPIITPLVPINTEDERRWLFYPQEIEQFVLKKLKR